MVAGFKIKEIELRSEEGTRFSPKALTIIVGPNNAGKSRFEWFDLDRKVVRDENGNYGVREYCNTGIQVINMVK